VGQGLNDGDSGRKLDRCMIVQPIAKKLDTRGLYSTILIFHVSVDKILLL